MKTIRTAGRFTGTAACIFIICLMAARGAAGTGLHPDSKWLAPHKHALDDSLAFFPSRIGLAGEITGETRFDAPEVCAACHTDIYNQWKQSAMAHAWKDPVYRALLDRASEATDGAVDNFCIGCHSPIGLTTGKIAGAGKAAGDDAPGVDCESCHTVSRRTGLDNAAFFLDPPAGGRRIKHGPRTDAHSPYHETAYSELHTRSDFCAVCHNVTHPFNSTAIERTYDEWLESPYAEQGIQCQDCHMTPEPGVTVNPGKSAVMGKEREHIYSHAFAGANVPLMRHFGNDEMAEKNIAMLRSAATLEFVDPPERVEPGQLITLALRVSNVGAGHKLPTGFPEGREMWIDLKIDDGAGRRLYRSGAVEHGRTAPGTRSFKVLMGNEAGEVVELNVWEVARVLSDNRIPPMGHAIVEYTLAVPGDAAGPLSLSAELNYWPFSQHMIDELLGEEAFEVEIVTMTSASHKLPLGSAAVARR